MSSYYRQASGSNTPYDRTGVDGLQHPPCSLSSEDLLSPSKGPDRLLSPRDHVPCSLTTMSSPVAFRPRLSSTKSRHGPVYRHSSSTS